jgi:hypothetical protein
MIKKTTATRKPKSVKQEAPSVPVEKAEAQIIKEVMPVKEEVTYYTVEKWHGVKTVYKCNTCGTFRDTEGMIQNHVLKHYPRSDHAEILKNFKENK